MNTMSKDFVGDIISQRDLISKEFCTTYEKRINEIKSKINRNIFHQIKLIFEDKNATTHSYGIDALQLIDRATKLNITCLELLEQLSFTESAILSRSIIELCSTAIAICQDDNIYNDFLTNKKFESTKTISVTKKIIPEVARIWGDLSRYLIHVNSIMYGAQKSITEDNIKIKTEFRLTSIEPIIPGEQVEVLFDHIELITCLIQYTITIIFFHKGTHNGFEGYFGSDNKSFYMGDNGDISFKKLYDKIYNSH